MDTPCGDMPLDAKKLRRIQGFRLMDDRFMRACLEDNIPCVQLVLRIILDKPDLTVLSAQTQHPLESLRGTRSVLLDVFAQDDAGRLYNVEIQRKSVDAERGRLHSALIDASALEAGEAFSRLPESWVIFIMEGDPFQKGPGPVPLRARRSGERPGAERRLAHRVRERRAAWRRGRPVAADARFLLHQPG